MYGQIEGLSAQLAEYLKSPAITAHSDDDLTLVIATRRRHRGGDTLGIGDGDGTCGA
jgi:hypothetical protein